MGHIICETLSGASKVHQCSVVSSGIYPAPTVMGDEVWSGRNASAVVFEVNAENSLPTVEKDDISTIL